jgi:serine/threonine protein kinase
MSGYPVRFGKYLLLERINVGGMAEVFKSKTFGVAGFERILAIKRILPSLIEDDEFVRMFIDEARIAVQLNHANIVQIYELGKHGDHYYIAMEYLPSRDLRAILDKMRSAGQLMPIPQAAYVCSKVCEGLDYAHRKRDPAGTPMNIIHRDVSPQNILISYEGECKVIDFGIAKAANRASKTQAGVLKGKFAYMSPEQVRGLPIDRRSDIFAVGILLYEMLTGERLFIGESDFSTLERVRNAEVVPPTTFNKKITPELEQIVLKTLAREVEDRYQWASDLAEDLQRFLIEDRSIYSGKRLAAFMKETYAADIALERAKMEEHLKVGLQDGMPGVPQLGSGLTAPIPQSSDTQIPVHVEEETGNFVPGDNVGGPPGDPPPEMEGDAAGFDDGEEDKTFVIEASDAGKALGASDDGDGDASGDNGTSDPANRPPRVPEGGEDFLSDPSLYGDDDEFDDEGDATQVQAANPFLGSGGGTENERTNPGQMPSMSRGGGQSRIAHSDPGLAEPDAETVAVPMGAKANSPTLTGSGPQAPVGNKSAGANISDPVLAAMADDLPADSAIPAGGRIRPAGGKAPEMGAEALSGLVPEEQPPDTNIGPPPGFQEASEAPTPESLADEMLPAPPAPEITAQQKKILYATVGMASLLFFVVAIVAVVTLLFSGPGPATIQLVVPGNAELPSTVEINVDGRMVASSLPAEIKDLEPSQPHDLEIKAQGCTPMKMTLSPQPGQVMSLPVALRCGKDVQGAASGDSKGDGSKVAAKGAKGEEKAGEGDEKAAEGEGAAQAKPESWKVGVDAKAAGSGSVLKGATVFIDGKEAGKTPNFSADIPWATESVKVRVTMDGYEGAERTVPHDDRTEVAFAVELKEVAEKEPAPVADATPTPKKSEPAKRSSKGKKTSKRGSTAGKTSKGGGKGKMATLAVGTMPSAKVYVNGRNTGKTTPLMGARALKLPVGRHKLTFVEKGKNKKHTYIVTIKKDNPKNKIVITGLGRKARVFGDVSARMGK